MNNYNHPNYPLLAEKLYNRDLEPIPATPGSKYYKGVDWMRLNLPVKPWPKDHEIGLRTGKLTAIDIDICNPGIVQSLLSVLTFLHITRTGKAPKTLIPVVCPEVEQKMFSDGYVDQHGEMHRIEVLSYGQQFKAYGIHPDTNNPYNWSGDLLTHSLPEVSMDFILHLFDVFHDLACKQGWKNLSTQEKRAAPAVSDKKYDNTGNAPGSIYNRAVSISELLIHYDWKHYKGQYWTRPGKKSGVSASVFDDRILWPFTSSTTLAPDQPYDAFELLAQYEFNGDKSAAARALKEVA